MYKNLFISQENESFFTSRRGVVKEVYLKKELRKNYNK
jgi:hypothetical protein